MTPDRLQLELELLRQRYTAVEHGEDGGWVLMGEVPLPSGWDRPSTEVLVVIPPGYPATPPDNFFVTVGLRLQSGQPPSNYSESQTLIGRQWGQFSFHSQEWNPSAELNEGDNLLTFMLLVEKRLCEVN